jgi:hypothetical protein
MMYSLAKSEDWVDVCVYYSLQVNDRYTYRHQPEILIPLICQRSYVNPTLIIGIGHEPHERAIQRLSTTSR